MTNIEEGYLFASLFFDCIRLLRVIIRLRICLVLMFVSLLVLLLPLLNCFLRNSIP